MVVHQMAGATTVLAGLWPLWEGLPGTFAGGLWYMGELRGSLQAVADAGAYLGGGRLFWGTCDDYGWDVAAVAAEKSAGGIGFRLWLLRARDDQRTYWTVEAYVGYAVHLRECLYLYRGRLPSERIRY